MTCNPTPAHLPSRDTSIPYTYLKTLHAAHRTRPSLTDLSSPDVAARRRRLLFYPRFASSTSLLCSTWSLRIPATHPFPLTSHTTIPYNRTCDPPQPFPHDPPRIKPRRRRDRRAQGPGSRSPCQLRGRDVPVYVFFS